MTEEISKERLIELIAREDLFAELAERMASVEHHSVTNHNGYMATPLRNQEERDRYRFHGECAKRDREEAYGWESSARGHKRLAGEYRLRLKELGVEE